MNTQWLLGDLALSEFKKCFWESSYLHIQRSSNNYYENILKYEQLDTLLDLTYLNQKNSIELFRLREGKLESAFIPDGRNHKNPIASIYDAYSDGYSIVLNKLHSIWPSIAEMCLNLENEIQHKVRANLYITPPNAQCFKPHFDNHEVFVLQIHGSKAWRIYESPVELPIDEDNLGNYEFSAEASYSDANLRAGDFLYIPRGMVHSANSLGNISIHLTVGVHVLRELDIVKAAVDEAAKDVRILRNSIGNGIFNLSKPSATFGNYAAYENILLELKKVLEDDEKVDKIRNKLTKIKNEKIIRDLQYAERTSGLSLQTEVKTKENIECDVVTSNEVCEIRFRNKWVRGPATLTSTFDYIKNNKIFVIGNLPDTSTSEEKVQIVKRLMKEGLLLKVQSSCCRGEIRT